VLMICSLLNKSMVMPWGNLQLGQQAQHAAGSTVQHEANGQA
jgi:hypothetical protein